MKIFYAYNEHYTDMLEIFLTSMKDQWELMGVRIEDFKEKGQLAGGREADIMRKELLDYAFSRTKENEIFVMSDIDIVFYKPCIPVVDEEFKKSQNVMIGNYLEKREKDIVFQKENMNRDINMGFMAMKNNQKVKSFWKDVYDISLSKKIWDQSVVNDLLYANLSERTEKSSLYKENEKVVWDMFPRKIWNWGIGNADQEICLHHATWAVSKKEKFDQFEKVKAIVNHN